jgi:hypothetical protein
MPNYTFKEGTCAECGADYIGLICDKEPYRNVCIECRDSDSGVENAKSLRYRHFVAHYDGLMGEWVKSSADKKAKLREHDLVEVGDYNPKYLLEDVPRGQNTSGEGGKMTPEFEELWQEEVVHGGKSEG